MIKKDTWVLIHREILSPDERAPQIPEDTRKVPLEMWIKGFLMEDAKKGDEVKIKTRTGRIETGKLLEVEPSYDHDFGKYIPELLEISNQVRELTFGGEK